MTRFILVFVCFLAAVSVRVDAQELVLPGRQDAANPPPAQVVEVQPQWPVDCEPRIVTLPDYGPVGQFDLGVFIRAGFLYWFVEDGPLSQPLVTSGTEASQAILGRDGTQILYGGSDIDYGGAIGARLTTEAWFDFYNTIGAQVSGFFIEQKTDDFVAQGGPDGYAVLGRPFFDVQLGDESVLLAAFPDAFNGVIAVSSATQLWGGEANALLNQINRPDLRFDLLGGFRYLELSEEIRVLEGFEMLQDGLAGFLGNPMVAGAKALIYDTFDTRNQFYGGQVGARAQVVRGCWLADVAAKVAFGVNRQTLAIAGGTVVGDTPGSGQAGGGLLAVASNTGRAEHNQFSVIPEVSLDVGLMVNENLLLRIGYTFIYWTEVLRPGDHIVRQVNPNQVPVSLQYGTPGGDTLPTASFNSHPFWVQGVHGSIEFRY